MSEGNRATMDPSERTAMDDLEWSRGFDDDERPEGSTAQDGDALPGSSAGHGDGDERPGH